MANPNQGQTDPTQKPGQQQQNPNPNPNPNPNQGGQKPEGDDKGR